MKILRSIAVTIAAFLIILQTIKKILKEMVK